MITKVVEKKAVALRKMIKTIEEEANKGTSPKDIRIKIEIQTEAFSYNKKIFNQVMPYTLSKYIRRRALTIAFLKWKSNYRNLSLLDSYRNIKKFAMVFHDNFDIALEEAYSLNLSEEDLQPAIDIDQYIEQLKTVENGRYATLKDVDDGNLTFSVDIYVMLFLHLQIPVYSLDSDIYNRLNLSVPEDWIFFLEILRKHNLNRKSEMGFAFAEISRNNTIAKYYNFYNPIRIGSLCIFSIEIPECWYHVFINKLDYFIKDLTISVENRGLPDEIRRDLVHITKARNVLSLASALQLNENDVADKVWQYCKMGLLRIPDSGAGSVDKR